MSCNPLLGYSGAGYLVKSCAATELGRFALTQSRSGLFSRAAENEFGVGSRTVAREKKKKVLSGLIGPPMLPPKSLRRNGGLRASKMPRDRIVSSRWNSKRLPANWFVPPL